MACVFSRFSGKEKESKKATSRKMTAPPTVQEVQALRGRIAQLEADLAASTIVTHTTNFVGSCQGWHSWSGGIGTSSPSLGNAVPTALHNAKSEFTKWKTENPGVKIISEEFIWHGLESHLFAPNNVWMTPTCIIVVKYRDS